MVKFTNKVVSVYDRKTSMRLTDIEWKILDKICYMEKIRRKNLLEMILNYHSPKLGFTPAVRLFTLLYSYNKTKQKRHEPLIQKTLSHLK